MKSKCNLLKCRIFIFDNDINKDCDPYILDSTRIFFHHRERQLNDLLKRLCFTHERHAEFSRTRNIRVPRTSRCLRVVSRIFSANFVASLR